MLAAVEREVLGQRQRHARRQQSFHAGRIGERKKHHRAGQRAGVLEIADEKFRDVVLDAHRGEHDGKAGVRLQQPRLPDDLRGNAVVRQAVAGKNRQLLAAHQRVHAVNRGNARLDEFARIAPRKRIDRQTVHIAAIGGKCGCAAISRPAQAVKNAAQHLPGNRELKTFTKKPSTQRLT